MSAGLSGRPPLAGWAPVAVVLAVSAALLGFDLGARVLATNDEARFPMMARDILSNGHWLLPEISGVPMLNKPPLHAWLIALGAWPKGAVSQRAAVVPAFLGALGLAAVTYWIAQRVFGVGAGLAAGLIVATTAGVFAMARSAVPDMTLSLGIAAAMAAFVRAELDGRRSAWLGFYALVGVACWAKGPAGLLPLAVVVAYQLATSGWRGVTRMRSTVGVAMLVVLVAPWWALAAHVGQAQFLQDVVWADAAFAAQLDANIEAHGLGDRVAVLGAVPPARVIELFLASDVFVLASRFEGYGMALAEAISHGLPVVSTTAGAIPQTVPAGSGLLVPPNDAAALAGALRRVIGDR